VQAIIKDFYFYVEDSKDEPPSANNNRTNANKVTETRDYADYYQRINAMAKDKKWNSQ